jgi:hypothetical protein
MLIRSQDKEILINFNNSPAIKIMGTKGDVTIICSDTYETFVIGNYSTREKVMKVLDMIQEAYANAELIPMAVPNIGKMFTEAPASKENELLAEAFGEALMNKMVFQMPEDSEVEA